MKQYKANFNTYLMDELSIYSQIEKYDFVFKIEDIKNIHVLKIITEGNPGSVTVMLQIYKTQQDHDILLFINKIWKQKIIGARLWYIYKNECNLNIDELLSKDLMIFTDDYFYEKFEKYIK
jgi:hypothetical protein